MSSLKICTYTFFDYQLESCFHLKSIRESFEKIGIEPNWKLPNCIKKHWKITWLEIWQTWIWLWSPTTKKGILVPCVTEPRFFLLCSEKIGFSGHIHNFEPEFKILGIRMLVSIDTKKILSYCLRKKKAKLKENVAIKIWTFGVLFIWEYNSL